MHKLWCSTFLVTNETPTYLLNGFYKTQFKQTTTNDTYNAKQSYCVSNGLYYRQVISSKQLVKFFVRFFSLCLTMYKLYLPVARCMEVFFDRTNKTSIQQVEGAPISISLQQSSCQLYTYTSLSFIIFHTLCNLLDLF